MTTTIPSEDAAKNAVKVWSLAKSISVAMLTTPGAGANAAANNMQQLDSRPMRSLFDERDSAIWFIVPRSHAAERQAMPDKQALLTFSNGGGAHVVFHGAVDADDNRAKLKELWNGHADIAFPKGAADPNATLLKFVPARASFWSGGSDIISFVVNFLEAKFTGEAQKVGEHGVVAAV